MYVLQQELEANRKKLGFSLTDMARALGCSQVMIFKVEKCKARFGERLHRKFTDTFGVTIVWDKLPEGQGNYRDKPLRCDRAEVANVDV